MKLKTVALLLLSICSLSGRVNAQQVTYSPYEKFDFRTGDYSVIGKVGGNLFTYRGSADGYFLDAYNDSMQELATVVLDFFPSKIYQTQFVAYPDHIIVLFQSLDGTKITQYAALLDNSGRLKKGPIQLDNTRTSIFGTNRVYFSTAVSEDKKHILVYSAEDKGSTLNFTAKWLDDQLNIVNRSHATFSADNNVSHGEVIVSNNGDIYLPVYTPVGTKNYADELMLLTMHPGETKFATKELPLNSKFAANSYMKMDNINNRIYIGGFFSSKKNGNFEGVLYSYFDIKTDSFQNKKMIMFDPELLKATGERNKKKAIDNFDMRQLIVKNDGGFVLISEEYVMSMRSNYAPGFGYYSWYYGPMSTTIREYHYGDIMALSYNGDGTKQWSAFVYKDQYSQEDGGLFSSYVLLNTGGTLGFLFNDFNTSNSHIQLATLGVDDKVNMQSF
ncbi:MAG TPA: hypothetical protein VN721_17025, partial [Flavipsychrobacter sp.]|nr:hypothetical protein [Flavipsychrobacter sp.]